MQPAQTRNRSGDRGFMGDWLTSRIGARVGSAIGGGISQ